MFQIQDPFSFWVSTALSLLGLGISMLQWRNVGPTQTFSFFRRVSPLAIHVAATILLVVNSVAIAWAVKDGDAPTVWTMSISGFLSLAVVVSSALLLFTRNRSQRDVFHLLHLFSHDLRDEHQKIQRSKEPFTSDLEKKILKECCVRISEIFSKLTRAKCHSAVFLVDPKSDIPRSVELWAHDKEGKEVARKRFEIEKNTRFRLVKNHDKHNQTAAFFSPNLDREKGYEEEDGQHRDFKSCIVVPLRCAATTADGQTTTFTWIGFLVVKTKDTYRLNGDFHVEVAASCADQIYLFLDSARLRRKSHSGNVSQGGAEQTIQASF
jgi:hypothetical protein